MTTSDPLRDLLKPRRLTAVVDVGANPIDGDPPYKSMLDAGLCKVTGFEPQPDALAKLQANKGPNERYLPYVVGDGNPAVLKVCAASGMTSLLEPDPPDAFETFRPYMEVTGRIPVQTTTLDDINEIKHLDFLKIDIQGGELDVFEYGWDALEETVVIQTEVSFVTLYKEQPTQGEIDLELRTIGFVPHGFVAMKIHEIGGGVPGRQSRQLLEADMVYVRDFTKPMATEQLKHLALIAHHCYDSVDLTLRCIMLLEERGALRAGAQQRYLEMLAH